MLTGDAIKLFLDRDDLQWGENWRNRVIEALTTGYFFVPVLTPRYLLSEQCRFELDVFARTATDLGVKELILPLLYAEVPSLHEESPIDSTARLLKSFQWEDWTDLRFEDRHSAPYRRGVNRLARRLVDANATSEQSNIPARIQELEQEVEEDIASPDGLLDRLAASEETLPKWTQTTESITHDIESIGEMMQRAVSELQTAESHGKGFAGRLFVAHKLSEALEAPIDSIWHSANDFVSQLQDVDGGVRTMIELGAQEALTSPESKLAICGFFNSVRNLSDSSRAGFDGTQGMIESIAALEPMSRDLRPPLRKLRQALSKVVEARQVTDDWARLIAETGLECGEDPGLAL